VEFSEFLRWKALVKRERPDVVDLSETRIARAFADIRPVVEPSPSFKNLHRCDLARTWCEVRGLPEALTKRTLVCEGVRHALRFIFRMITVQGSRIAIPRDVYPVYWQISADAGAQPLALDTFPDFDLEALLGVCATEGVRNVLLPSPLKLHGRRWTVAEASGAATWLREDPLRRLILDGVYSFGGDLDAATLALIDTNQVLYLDSLSKGWLHEKVFGAAIVPAEDQGFYERSFRESLPRQDHLYLALEMLSTYRDFPKELKAAIEHGRSKLLRVSEQAGLPMRAVNNGYFMVIEKSANEVLDKHGLLTIPVAVFGSTVAQFCVASGLPISEAS